MSAIIPSILHLSLNPLQLLRIAPMMSELKLLVNNNTTLNTSLGSGRLWLLTGGNKLKIKALKHQNRPVFTLAQVLGVADSTLSRFLKFDAYGESCE
jgi:hypothetical protein